MTAAIVLFSTIVLTSCTQYTQNEKVNYFEDVRQQLRFYESIVAVDYENADKLGRPAARSFQSDTEDIMRDFRRKYEGTPIERNYPSIKTLEKLNRVAASLGDWFILAQEMKREDIPDHMKVTTRDVFKMTQAELKDEIIYAKKVMFYL